MRYAAAALAIVVFGACSGSDPEPRPPVVERHEVEIRDIAFRPAAIEIEPGTWVEWVNRDLVEHWVTSGFPRGEVVPQRELGPKEREGVIFLGWLGQRGSRFSRRFDSSGDYPYFCRIHPAMRGEIVVR